MRTRHSYGITRKTAKELFAGSTGAGPEELIRVLRAATAPGRESELAGEQAAVAAFEANHLGPVATPRRRKMINFPLAKLLTVKAVSIALAACVTGSAAAAAATVALSGGSGPTPQGPSGNIGQPVTATTGTGTKIGATTPSAPVPSTGAPSASPASQPLDVTGLCHNLAVKVASAAGDLTSGANTTAGGALSQVGLEQALANPAVAQVLYSPTFESLLQTVSNVAAIPDYCALLLNLPTLPQPTNLTRVPVSVLSEALTALPSGTLAQVLTALPTGTLTQVLGELKPSALSQILTILPGGSASAILTRLPASALGTVLTTLPSSALSTVLTTLPASALSTVLATLPSSVLGTVLTTLPSSALSTVLTTLPAGSASQILSKLPSSILSGIQSELPSSILSHLPLLG